MNHDQQDGTGNQESSSLIAVAKTYAAAVGAPIGVSQRTSLAVILFPVAISFLFALLLTIPATRKFALDQLKENRPVELLTFAFLIVAGVWAMRLALRTRKYSESIWLTGYYGLLGFMLVIGGMEEVAWGQWFFDFETPQQIKEINLQRETTLHNIEGFHGKTEYARLTFGVAGLAMVLFPIRRLWKIMPPAILLSWYATITLLVIPDLYYDFASHYDKVGILFDRLSELNELLIAAACLIYLRYTQSLIGPGGSAPDSADVPSGAPA